VLVIQPRACCMPGKLSTTEFSIPFSAP
jgi:hypothetical protein